MLILLPPSEGKAHGGTGPPVDLPALSWPELAAPRQRVLDVLLTICRRQPARARALLGLSDALDADRAANAVADSSPTMPAGHRYTGVLHDALGYPSLPAAARRRADASVVVFSGLWGAVRPTDLLPAYRIGIGTHLPRIPPLPRYWRQPLLDALGEEVAASGALDLRSSGYSQMFKPVGDPAKVVTVTITGSDGRRAASSYQSKVAKGRLARALVLMSRPGVASVPQAAESIGLRVDASPTGLVLRLPDGWGLVASSKARAKK